MSNKARPKVKEKSNEPQEFWNQRNRKQRRQDHYRYRELEFRKQVWEVRPTANGIDEAEWQETAKTKREAIKIARELRNEYANA